jgi:hypothetical protein
VEAIGGRPSRLPFTPRASPARTRYAIIVRSDSANTPKHRFPGGGRVEAGSAQKEVALERVLGQKADQILQTAADPVPRRHFGSEDRWHLHHRIQDGRGGEALAISVPPGETRVLKQFQQRMPCGCSCRMFREIAEAMSASPIFPSVSLQPQRSRERRPQNKACWWSRASTLNSSSILVGGLRLRAYDGVAPEREEQRRKLRLAQAVRHRRSGRELQLALHKRSRP